MANRYTVPEMADALEQHQYPTIMLWNRLEGRPRTVNFERALRAEVRDALWMVTRQWQVGEYRGEDAGSPVFAKLQVATTQLTRFQPGDAPAMDFDLDVPLETQVERQPWRLTIGNDPVALDLRLMLGRRWLKLIAGIGDYGALFIDKFKIDLPNPTRSTDAALCAHPDVWQSFAAVAGRVVDGAALYLYLTTATGRHPYDGLAVLQSHKAPLDVAARKFVEWVDVVLARPDGNENPAWQPARLEYRFACAAPTAGGEKVYTAEEYYQGTLDWYGLDVDPGAGPMGTGGGLGNPATDPRKSITRTMIPVPLTYAGMPHPRWWTIEDGRTNFGDVRPDTTDLAKLLFIEFGLVYSNDWFLVPFTLQGGSIAAVQGLAVTTVFGERYWIESAAKGSAGDVPRGTLYAVSVRGGAKGDADPSLLFLPTVPKVQEGKPLEEILLMRDEMANMVWGIEKVIPAADGSPRGGGTAGRELRNYFERLVAASGGGAIVPPLENEAKIRYDVMTSVPENWIPFIPVRAKGSQRAIELQRAALPRIIEGDSAPPARVRPRTSLLRSGLDQVNPQPYLVPEEEVPRAGVRVTLAYQRTRWLGGRVFVWSGVRKQTGRGEGSSGLAFDRLVDVPTPG